MPDNTPILRVRDLKKHFPVRGSMFHPGRKEWVRAVDGVSFDLGAGRTLGVVGESGCGKTTMGRVVMGLDSATAGEVRVGDSPDLTTLGSRDWMPWRRRVQMVFQDPFSSLNPRMTVGSIVGEALSVHKLAPNRAARRDRVAELFAQVGLSPDAMDRFPHEFSGGQRQRVGVARALAVEPDIIIADEPVSALDVSIQAQIINLLRRLQQEHGLAFVFISHDLTVVGHISHDVAVMYLGRIVETGTREQVFARPSHPYTEALMSAVPSIRREKRGKRILLEGDVPSPINPPSGCPFHPRCPKRFEGCDRSAPQPREVQPGHWATCRLYD